MKKFKYILHTIKFFVAFILSKTIYRILYKQNIWLIGEKKTEARDNAYHFFKYVRENHPEINAYFVITKDSADLNKIKKYGNIIYCYSMKHYIYFLTAKNNINSQLPISNSAFPFWYKLVKIFPFLLNKSQNCVFLQHGITKDEMSHIWDYDKSKISIFTCSAERERDFIVQTYGYPKENALLLGLCRYDNLHNKENILKKQIVVMPTFRNWLVASDVTKEAKIKENEIFSKSLFYKTYIDLMNSEKLTKLLISFDYELVFYPHYSLQSYINLFREDVHNNRIIIADRFHYDVQDLLICSSILITDFSSVFFDFAYMKKPEIFFQFDVQDYRENHYSKGYFSYENDGFGPVVKNADELLEELEKILLNDTKIEDMYLKRIEKFFALCDANNCKRTYEAINKLE